MTTTENNFVAEIEISYKKKVKSSNLKKIAQSSDIYAILKYVWSPNMEFIEESVLLCLNRANKVLGWVKISAGGMHGTVMDQKVIFSIALKCCASAIVIAHNHPSGSLRPSEQDIRITKTIKEGGRLLDIQLIDHLILSGEGYYSFADEGQI